MKGRYHERRSIRSICNRSKTEKLCNKNHPELPAGPAATAELLLQSPGGYQRRGGARVLALEYMRRFLQHVLPKGFVKLRHFGFLFHSSHSKAPFPSLITSGPSEPFPFYPRLHEPGIRTESSDRFLILTLLGGSSGPLGTLASLNVDSTSESCCRSRKFAMSRSKCAGKSILCAWRTKPPLKPSVLRLVRGACALKQQSRSEPQRGKESSRDQYISRPDRSTGA